MFARRLLLPFAALLLAASSFAQFTSDQKDEVLRGIDRVLSQEAFVPGVDLGKWRSFIEKRQDRIDSTESQREFAYVVNSALSEFGVSHIQLMLDRMGRGGEVALQGRRWGQRPRPMSLRWIDDDSAVLRLSTFDTGYDEATVEQLFEDAKEAKYLVLDLRSNPGGEVENMRHFLGLVLSSDTAVGTFVSRRMARDYSVAVKGEGKDPVAIAAWANRKFKPRRPRVEPFAGKMAVLIDGRSASASEIVANALRELKKAPVVGTKSMGAVLMSTFDKLPYGFKIQYPVSDYVSANGIRLEGHPIAPDITATATMDDPDAPLNAALDRIKNRSLMSLSLWSRLLRTN